MNKNRFKSMFHVHDVEVVEFFTNSSSSWTRWKIAFAYLFNKNTREFICAQKRNLILVSVKFSGDRSAVQYANSQLQLTRQMIKEGFMLLFLAGFFIGTTIIAINRHLSRFDCPAPTVTSSNDTISPSANCGYEEMQKFETKYFSKLNRKK